MSDLGERVLLALRTGPTVDTGVFERVARDGGAAVTSRQIHATLFGLLRPGLAVTEAGVWSIPRSPAQTPGGLEGQNPS